MKIRTLAASMGVRGTDFLVDSKKDTTNLLVVRGKIQVVNELTKEAIDIKRGYSAQIVREKPVDAREKLLTAFDDSEIEKLDKEVMSLKITLAKSSKEKIKNLYAQWSQWQSRWTMKAFFHL